ncbi:hypothetical protein F7Q99_36115 [Streptomyces kaniharaensis]|uniref:Uncharacterized protein n=1 Tax=Streptomyces kaniharaensis TaxID=212423 RepID=A0A6N7L4D5_9ACTN|nr:hypothetical protein [Streptomyces kaniharaensis]MQS17468.1 hypothetical protein [Streptomyces kaniharaensis]
MNTATIFADASPLIADIITGLPETNRGILRFGFESNGVTVTLSRWVGFTRQRKAQALAQAVTAFREAGWRYDPAFETKDGRTVIAFLPQGNPFTVTASPVAKPATGDGSGVAVPAFSG